MSDGARVSLLLKWAERGKGVKYGTRGFCNLCNCAVNNECRRIVSTEKFHCEGYIFCYSLHIPLLKHSLNLDETNFVYGGQESYKAYFDGVKCQNKV
jgi:hypothetical protein